jgi:ABC-type multidrug transport system fused ATPase/permease subunit
MLLAEIGSGDLFLGILQFFFLFILLVILFQVIADLFRDHTLSGWAKAVWVFFLIILPPLTILVYLIARGSGMQKRAIEQRQAMEAQMADYVKTTASGVDPATQIANAKALHDAGTITDAEFEQLKAKALA